MNWLPDDPFSMPVVAEAERTNLYATDTMPTDISILIWDGEDSPTDTI